MVLHSSFFIQQLKFKCLLIYYGLQLSYHVRIESPTFHWYDLPSRMWISIFGKLIIYNYDYVNYRGILLLPRSRSGRLSDAESLRLSLKSWKSIRGSSFVKISAIWYLEGIWRTLTWPRTTFSRTKWMSISMCFVRWCWTGLPER
jgi:hypothetical protein